MKSKFPYKDALAVAHAIKKRLAESCERVEIAGSIRRHKKEVGDVEILYVPKNIQRVPPGGLFAEDVNAADVVIARLEEEAILARRQNVNGSEMFGEKNKLMIHAASEIPVDLFATSEAAWWNYLVCRTGGAENNMQIATAAKEKGWKWNPYSMGFSRRVGLTTEIVSMGNEREVFKFVGLAYLEPWERK